MTTEKFLALFGLFLAVIELYIPKLSIWLEELLDRFQHILKPTSSSISKSPKKLREFIQNETLIGEFYNEYKGFFFIVYVGIAVISLILENFVSESFFEIYLGIISIPLVLILIVIAIYSLSIYFYYIFIYVPLKILGFLVFIFSQIIRGLNFIGNNKAISGIGFCLAIYGVLSLDW